MAIFQERKKSKKKIYSKIILISVIILAIFLIGPTWRIWQKHVTVKQQIKLAEQELSRLKEREAHLKSEAQRLESESGKEQEIIKKFDVVKEGENLAIILESGEEEKVEEKKEKGFFGKFFGWFSSE